MTRNILFSAEPSAWQEYQAPLTAALDTAGVDAHLSCDHAPGTVDYIVFAPNGPVSDFRPFARTKAVLGLWAGVESVVNNPTLTQPLARMVDEGLTQGMVEWVTGHVLRHHLGMDAHILGQDGQWRAAYPPLARARRVGILGLGALGQACGQALRGLGFPVTGWSRGPKQTAGLRCVTGQDGLHDLLSSSDIVVLLLPLTPATTDILNAETIALLPRDAVIINPGRGAMIDDTALLSALDHGHIAHATLDVFRVEPLPKDHPFWAHAKVTVTPHIASTTRADTAAEVIAQNIARVESGLPLLHQVNRDAGY
jgi:glyoxylate/hydroxypyruvate reductase A